MAPRRVSPIKVNIASLLISCAWFSAGTAEAQNVSLFRVEKGADGKDWYWQARPDGKSDPVDSTAGAPGGDLTLVTTVSNAGNPAKSTIVEVGSVGGKGAVGELFAAGGISGSTTYYTVGKDGGRGGNVSLTLNGSLVGDANLTTDTALLSVYSIGGDGFVGRDGPSGPGAPGQGGAAGAVRLDLSATVSTTGDHFGGVWAKSQGGQTGRNVADAWAIGVSTANASKYPGANGNMVTVSLTKDAVVSTHGSYAPGVIAESIGGAGLDGGTYRNILPGAGQGGAVSFTNEGKIVTDGTTSTGVLLQSVGGRGGRQVVQAPSGDYSGEAGGGAGGNAGNGGTVTARQAGSIETKQDYSFGLAAMSMGGVGGDAARATGGRPGGNGGAAGNGGRVDVQQVGDITTRGEGSVGVLAQSLGGGGAVSAFQRADIKPGAVSGGGAGGGSSSAFWPAGEGGTGGAGGQGGTVTVVNDGTILTEGNSAIGMLIQSVGGGGGAGGGSKSVFSILLGTAAGGAGGGGGDGGLVQVNASSAGVLGQNVLPSITTKGNSASGIVAQSVGGGGGAGGAAQAGTAGLVVSLSYAVGGAGGKGGAGGSVLVDNTSIITTSGKESHGIEARSVGGGGGRAGDASAQAVAASPPSTEAFSITYAVGGSGGDGGAGGTVSVINASNITTSGEKSYGILATSIGGGGGNAGAASAISDVAGVFHNVSIAVGVGGSGGGGGHGDLVDVANLKSIETKGAFSAGIMAVSIGGGGGDGGTGSASGKKGVTTDNQIASVWAESLPIADVVAYKVAIGGSGGSGGDGGLVLVNNAASIQTWANESKGIVAQSIGGGGGNGGGYISGGGGEFARSLSLGGSGGNGGAGGKVDVANAAGATIRTHGDGSAAIFAQSIGGGGGSGGSMSGAKKAVSVPKTAQATTDAVLQIADEIFKVNKTLVSQAPGAGLDLEFFQKKGTQQEQVQEAKKVIEAFKAAWDSVKADLKKNEEIRKENKEREAKGLEALPEIPVPLTIAKAFYESNKQAFLERVKSQFTEGVKSGIQELIGKAPDGTKSPVSVSLSIGGSGGKGGAGGDLDVRNAGLLATEGNVSYGVFAQSIGGGGGAGGGGVTNGSNFYNIGLSIGGSGEAGGTGGSVQVTNSGEIVTLGGGSFGVFAQSIGGGGGVGGGAANTDAVASVTATVNVGGATAATSNGGSVTVRNTGHLATSGQEAHAIVAQSIGGGGGAYFLDRKSPISAELLVTSQDAYDALIKANDILKDFGLGAIGEYSQADRSWTSILPPVTASANIGGRALSGSEGEGKNGGAGGAVVVRHSGTIETSGLGAFGIFAQSIGGGGGFGAHAMAAEEIVRNTVLGGTSGTTGNGGTVTVQLSNNSVIKTSGAGATAVFAQSIGGGGGYAGAGTGTVTLASPTEWTKWLPPLLSYGDPFGDYSDGIWISGKHGATGDGGSIYIQSANDVTGSKFTIATTGERAHGIFAQSLGGGGGAWFNVDGGNLPTTNSSASRDSLMKGVGGAIRLDTNGSITATGRDSYAIFTQSGVQKADGSIDSKREVRTDLYQYGTMIFHKGTLWGGSGAGAAIRMDGGHRNYVRLESLDPESMVGAASGKAIIGSFGTDIIDNYSRVIGDIDLGTALSDPNEFRTRAGGTYQSLEGTGTIKLGAGGEFYNDGVVTIGGIGTFGTLLVQAKQFRQTNNGTLLVDVTSSPTPGASKSDLLRLTAPDGVNTAPAILLAGGMKVNVVGNLKPEEFKVISTTGTISGPVFAGSANSLAPFAWETRLAGAQGQSNGSQDLYIKPVARFGTPAGASITPTEQAAMRSLQNTWNAGTVDDKMAEMFGNLARVTSVEDYLQAIDTLAPEESSSSLTTQTLNARTSMHAALSCPVFEGSSTLMQETDCAWARVIGTWTDQGSSAEADGYKQNALTYRVGVQREVVDNWFLGATAGFTQSWLNGSDSLSSATGNAADAAISLKHQVGPWLFALSGHLGFGNYRTTRTIDVGSDLDQTQGTANVLTAAGRFRASYEFAFSDWYVKPYADFDLLYTYMPAYEEQGIGTTLDFSSASQVNFAFSPNLEVGGRVDLSPSLWLRPYGSVGMTFFAKDAMPVSVSLSDASHNDDFTTYVAIPSTLVNLAAGIQLFDTRGYEIRAEYKADIGNDYLSQELSARFAVRF
ncbi:autotransporter outer membrane beta-barrel domain-containing protein [Aquabacter sediminis]|uniref:autotransporter outer membrane beta-barrel domain-containing protein n=1 Tax=Aquabacter sediminis TaxID=3029197 RepID=UPI00237D4E75|nr:autotransporter outer membrane beta-barrel domain-containing protein [Aquabacter sp. P-9]MDE1567041.1 autotransporter outer membrane beta-barrel domain-containing protein [Aquabacter sp. P-9]